MNALTEYAVRRKERASKGKRQKQREQECEKRKRETQFVKERERERARDCRQEVTQLWWRVSGECDVR